MSLSQGGLAALYLWSLILGGCFGATYDLLRITRVLLGVHYSRRTTDRLRAIRLPLLPPICKRRRSRLLGIVIFLEDLLFCLLVGVVMILLFYSANHGRIRLPAFLLAAVGFLLYRASIGRAVMAFSEVIAFFLEVFIRYVLFFACYPFRLLYRWVRYCARRMAVRLRLSVQKRARRRYTAVETARIFKNACGLIPDEIHAKESVKRGKQIVRQKQKTVQPNAARSYAVGRAGGHLHRYLRK